MTAFFDTFFLFVFFFGVAVIIYALTLALRHIFWAAPNETVAANLAISRAQIMAEYKKDLNADPATNVPRPASKIIAPRSRQHEKEVQERSNTCAYYKKLLDIATARPSSNPGYRCYTDAVNAAHRWEHEFDKCLEANRKSVSEFNELLKAYKHNLKVLEERDARIAKIEGLCAYLTTHCEGPKAPEEQFDELLAKPARV